MTLNHYPKPPNAVCVWCENYDHKSKWCFTYKKNITHHDSLKPRRCTYYKGEVLTDENFKSARDLLLGGQRRL